MRNYDHIQVVVDKLINGVYEYRDGEIFNKQKGVFLKGNLKGHKYKSIAMRFNGKNNRAFTHLVVFAYFHGIEELKCHETIDHINGNRHDNRIENLQGLSLLDNSLKGNGVQNFSRKLSEEAVREIRQCNLTDSELSRKFGVHRKTIYEIKKGIRYKQFL